MPAEAAQMLRAIVASLKDGYVELRPIGRGRAGKSEAFHVTDYANAAQRAVELGRKCDVYFGVVPRVHEGGRSAADVGPATVVWADLDSVAAMVELVCFVEPSIVVASGSEAHHHAYWLLDAPHDAEEVVALNRDLARHLGADVQATDAARILRLPGTLNHKTSPPSPVRLASLSERRYAFEALRNAVPSEASKPSSDHGAPRAGKLLVRVLERLDQVREGAKGWTACCPAHDDQTPSLSIREGARGRILVKCHAGCSFEEIEEALDMAGELSGSGAKRGDKDTASHLIELVHDTGVELFHDPKREPYALIQRDGHREVWSLRGGEAEEWLQGLYYRETKAAISAQALRAAVGTLGAQAIHDGPEHPVFHRVAGDLDRMYIDLGDERWRVVEIDAAAGAWRVLDRSPVAFTRAPGSLPLPQPERGGSIDELRQLVNVTSDEDWSLYRGALLSLLHPLGPYPVVFLAGDEGSGKTTAAWFISQLVDPCVGPFPIGTPDMRDLMANAVSGWLPGYDNLSQIPQKLSDVICQLTSGTAIRSRKFHTNAGLFIAEARRPVIFTAIKDIVKSPDLVDRIIGPSRMRRLSHTRDEQEVLAEFERIKGRVFAGMLDALAGGLHELPRTKPERLPRIASCAMLVTAAERAMGWTEGEFCAAIFATQAAGRVQSIESSLVASSVVQFMETRDEWMDSATALLDQLTKFVGDRTAHSRDWPTRPDQVTTELQAHAHALRSAGLHVESGRHNGGNRSRYIRITRIPTTPSKDTGTGRDGR